MPTERQPLIGRLLAGVVVLAGLAVAAAFAWAIVNGEAAVVTAATAILVFAAGELFSRRRAANQYRWDKIGPTYEAFIKLVREVGNEGKAKPSEQKTLKVMGDFSDKLMLWGSPAVVEAWASSRRVTDSVPEPPTEEVVLAYARVLLAIRKDLGHGDWTLEARDLLRVTINDIDEFLPPGTRP